MLDKRPKKLNVLGFEYAVEYHADQSAVDWKRRESLWGQVDFQTSTIRIFDDGSRPDAEVWQTVWHEIGHVIFYICGRTFNTNETPDEEMVVDQFASGVVSVLRNNARVFG